MGKITVSVPRLRFIAERYYWRPTPATKALGFRAEALGVDLSRAIERAKELNAAVEKSLAGEPSKQIIRGSVADLCRIYRNEEAFLNLAEATRKGYEKILGEIESKAGDFIVAEITKRGMKVTYQALKPRGLHQAAAHMRMWSILMNLAVDEEWRRDNPASKLKIQTPPSREVRWAPEEVETFCNAAIKNNRPSLKLAVLLAYRLFQREGDVLRLTRSAIKDGAVRIKQNKTGAEVVIAIDSALQRALEAAPKGDATTLVVSEATGRPYKADHFRHEFAKIRELAKLPKRLRFADLRRSALTEAGEGGATIAELQAVSGHKTISQLTTYVRPTTEMAKSAVRKRARVAKAADRH